MCDQVHFGNVSHILSSIAFKCMPLFHMFKIILWAQL